MRERERHGAQRWRERDGEREMERDGAQRWREGERERRKYFTVKIEI